MNSRALRCGIVQLHTKSGKRIASAGITDLEKSSRIPIRAWPLGAPYRVKSSLFGWVAHMPAEHAYVRVLAVPIPLRQDWWVEYPRQMQLPSRRETHPAWPMRVGFDVEARHPIFVTEFSGKAAWYFGAFSHDEPMEARVRAVATYLGYGEQMRVDWCWYDTAALTFRPVRSPEGEPLWPSREDYEGLSDRFEYRSGATGALTPPMTLDRFNLHMKKLRTAEAA